MIFSARPVILTALFLTPLVTLSACEGTKEQLGLTRTAPDEFAVVKRAPLELPPDYSVRPPQPGAQRPQEAAATEQARTVIFGEGGADARPTPADGEAALLQKAGTDEAQPGIREAVDRETATLEPYEKPVSERLLGWTTGNDQPPASVVDAAAEAERLRENSEQGKPLTEGKTPTIEE